MVDKRGAKNGQSMRHTTQNRTREETMVKGLYTVVMWTPNTKRLAKFYSETIGLKVNHDCPMCTVLELQPDQSLVVHKDKSVKPLKSPKNFRVSIGFKTENVDWTFSQLKTKKVKFTEPPTDRDWGARTASALDPDGNLIEFIQVKPELFDAKKYEAQPEREPVAA